LIYKILVGEQIVNAVNFENGKAAYFENMLCRRK